jgi:PAS domain S-box-containing protein
MENTIKILHLEDDPNDALLLQTVLRKSKIRFEYYLADNEDAYHSFLTNNKFDIILSDYNLPDYSGNDALKWAREKYPHIPFIFVSGVMGEEAAIESLLNGATDYVLKNKMERLGLAVTRAIKEKGEQEARLKAEKEVLKLSRAVEQSPNSVIITDTSGRIEYANPNAEVMTGFSGTELIGANPRIFSSGRTPKAIYESLWKTILAGDVWQGEILNKKKNGELYWENALVSPVIDENGDTINFLAIKTDITTQKQLTEELIIAKEKAEESDRLKTAFLTNISHEIRTPMNGILGFAELLEVPELTGEEQQNYIRIIKKSGDRMLNIINELVDISKIESGLMPIFVAETNINDQIEFLYSFFELEAEAKGLQMTYHAGLQVNESVICTDKEKVFAILSNLLENAIKYTNEGSIEFGYKFKPCSSDANGKPGIDFIEFYIKDTGIGIPADRLQAIFERFIQADISDRRAFQGAGLGLSIAKAYVGMLGGKIWVESEEGKGSVFYFTLPYLTSSNKNNTFPENSAIGDTNKSRKFKILIVEDDETSEMLLTIALEKLNAVVLNARSGHQAVEMCRSNPDIDIVLMDIKMYGMNGYEATKEIRTFNDQLPIIAQTAFGQIGDKEKAMQAGCSDYITKPIDITSLRELIQQQLDKTKL